MKRVRLGSTLDPKEMSNKYNPLERRFDLECTWTHLLGNVNYQLFIFVTFFVRHACFLSSSTICFGCVTGRHFVSPFVPDALSKRGDVLG